MYFTRSIRRKMVTGATVSLVALFLLYYNSTQGLKSYRSVVNDLDYSINQAPRRADLIDAIAPLQEPLLSLQNPNPMDVQGSVEFHRKVFLKRLQETQQAFREFRNRLEEMPGLSNSLDWHVNNSILNDADNRMAHLEQLQQQLLLPEKREAIRLEMIQRVAYLMIIVQGIYDPGRSLNETLHQARRSYESRLLWVRAMGVVVLVLFLFLTGFAWWWVVVPISRLHVATMRVRGGDLNYRLPVLGRDEMSELAEEFNKMTARFQETKQHLAEEVKVQSQQLVRSERLGQLGILTAGVAHEVNNPLQAISMSVDSLQYRLMDPGVVPNEKERADMRELLETLEQQTARCKKLTTQLLNVSRKQETSRSNTDVCKVVNEALDLVHLLKKYRDREIRFDVDGPVYLEINGDEIQQVAVNLVTNALDSMKPGGLLEISIEEQVENVILVFKDDGCGMTAEVREKLFDPFFTRKPAGVGTGLGLSITQSIVHQHGGSIHVHSDGEGQGSTFRIRLPRKAARSGAA